MSKKYLLALAATAAALCAGAIAVVVVRRTRTEPPPVSPTVPRVEELPLGRPVDDAQTGFAAS
ncbi:hypothetical protein GCM10009624_35860 [Gordonia sinesedis]